jgi:hypothetical protein
MKEHVLYALAAILLAFFGNAFASEAEVSPPAAAQGAPAVPAAGAPGDARSPESAGQQPDAAAGAGSSPATGVDGDPGAAPRPAGAPPRGPGADAPFGPGRRPGQDAQGRPKIERIDKFRARIGEIVLDRKARSFKVPGKVIWEQGPLEFLAVTRGGRKGYESVLELDVSAHEFNLACVLIGLPSRWGKTPRFHFDPEPAVGKAVAVSVSWEKDGERVEVPAHELFVTQGEPPPSHRWIYTGSRHARDRRFLAEEDGTLIGFVHDPASIIEHREGMGLGNYGSVGVKPGLLPGPGTPVEVTVRWMSRKEAGMEDMPDPRRRERPGPGAPGPAPAQGPAEPIAPGGESAPGPGGPGQAPGGGATDSEAGPGTPD